MLSGLVSLQSGTLGEELSGKNQMLGTAEYSLTVIPLRRRDLWKVSLRLGVELAVFADAGIAWSESPDFTTRRARGALGGGLRLLVPGSEMVRLDVGWSPDYGSHFHFANGTKPKASARGCAERPSMIKAAVRRRARLRRVGLRRPGRPDAQFLHAAAEGRGVPSVVAQALPPAEWDRLAGSSARQGSRRRASTRRYTE